MIIDVILDALLDTLKVLPFLFPAYLLIEFLEHRSEDASTALIHRAGSWGPVIGSALGIIPQCGFSAATADLYAGGIITRGTLIAVFLSTSDEMLPIMISENVPAVFILKVLACKLVYGMAAGLIIDMIVRARRSEAHKEPHDICEEDGCNCEEGIVKPALFHTLKIAVFLFITTAVISFAVELVGEDRLAGFIMNVPVAGEFLAGLVGLIPNCAASVIITKLYLSGAMTAGAMMSGLLTGAGIGTLVMFRMNRHNLRENLVNLVLLYVCGVAGGILAGVTGIF